MEKQNILFWSRHLLEGTQFRPKAILAVMKNPRMTLSEKRALLASWASDARAIPDHPYLRKLDDGSLATIDDITAAMKQLDTMPVAQSLAPFRGWLKPARKIWKGPRDDDDNDPPPAPAGIAPRPPLLTGGEAAAA